MRNPASYAGQSNYCYTIPKQIRQTLPRKYAGCNRQTNVKRFSDEWKSSDSQWGVVLPLYPYPRSELAESESGYFPKHEANDSDELHAK
jgi:hypothetical protein